MAAGQASAPTTLLSAPPLCICTPMLPVCSPPLLAPVAEKFCLNAVHQVCLPPPPTLKGYRGTPCALTPNLMDCCSSDEQSAQWTIDGHNFPGCLQIHRGLHSRCVANGGPWAVVKSLSSWVLCVALPVPHTVALPRGQSPGCPLRGAGLPAGQGRLHSIPLRVWGRGLRLAQQGLFQAPPGRGTGPHWPRLGAPGGHAVSSRAPRPRRCCVVP